MMKKKIHIGFVIIVVTALQWGKIVYAHEAVIAKELVPPAVDQIDQKIKSEALKTLKGAIQKLLDMDYYKAEMQYSVFYNNTTNFTQPSESTPGTIIKRKDNFLQTEEGNVTLLNKNYQIHIREKTKLIVVMERREQKIPGLDFNVDSLSKVVTDVRSIPNGFQIDIEKGELSKIDIELDEHGFIKKWRNYYRDKKDFGDGAIRVVLEVFYKNIEQDINVSSEYFSELQYVSIDPKTKEISGVGKFKNYTVINQLPKK
ncbi:MAG: hypothetical protein WDZ35_11235 [Crocinitomicaceae bacterium]